MPEPAERSEAGSVLSRPEPKVRGRDSVDLVKERRPGQRCRGEARRTHSVVAFLQRLCHSSIVAQPFRAAIASGRAGKLRNQRLR